MTKSRGGGKRRDGGGTANDNNQEAVNGSWGVYLDRKREQGEREDQAESRRQGGRGGRNRDNRKAREPEVDRWEELGNWRQQGQKNLNECQDDGDQHRGDSQWDRYKASADLPRKLNRDLRGGQKDGVTEELQRNLAEDAQSEGSTESTSSADGQPTIGFGEGSVLSSVDSVSPLSFGVIVYDLETIHDAERGTYVAKGIHECSYEEQMIWKRQSQIIEFAAIDIVSGHQICVRSRPEFRWENVRSHAARTFAEDHGHDKIVKDETLPYFKDVWVTDILPFLRSCAGTSNSLAIIAHNGDNFDHFVMAKELSRLGLMDEMPLVLHKFDPIRSLKNQFGQDFGSGGRLALGAVHSRYVPEAQRGDVVHQALADCVMLLEVIAHWVILRALLSTEIAATFADPEMVEDICSTLVSSFAMRAAQMQQPASISTADPRIAEAHASRPRAADRQEVCDSLRDSSEGSQNGADVHVGRRDGTSLPDRSHTQTARHGYGMKNSGPQLSGDVKDARRGDGRHARNGAERRRKQQRQIREQADKARREEHGGDPQAHPAADSRQLSSAAVQFQ